MTDQCKHCTVRGDFKACQATECHKHDDWHAVQLKARIATLEAELKQREWISVDGAESDIEVSGYYWWNPRSSENKGQENWQVQYVEARNPDHNMINRQGLFVGPIRHPSTENDYLPPQEQDT